MAGHDHPARAEVGGAHAAAVSGGKVVQCGSEVGEVSGGDGLGLPDASPPVRGTTAGGRPGVERVVPADPCVLRLEEGRELVRDVLGAEAVTGRVVTEGQLLGAGPPTGVRELAGSNLRAVCGRDPRPEQVASGQGEDRGGQAEERDPGPVRLPARGRALTAVERLVFSVGMPVRRSPGLDGSEGGRVSVHELQCATTRLERCRTKFPLMSTCWDLGWSAALNCRWSVLEWGHGRHRSYAPAPPPRSRREANARAAPAGRGAVGGEDVRGAGRGGGELRGAALPPRRGRGRRAGRGRRPQGRQAASWRGGRPRSGSPTSPAPTGATGTAPCGRPSSWCVERTLTRDALLDGPRVAGAGRGDRGRRRGAPPECRRPAERAEEVLLDEAGRLNATDLAKAAKHLVEVADPEGAEREGGEGPGPGGPGRPPGPVPLDHRGRRRRRPAPGPRAPSRTPR